MVCNVCGSEIREGAKYCPGCGGRVLGYPSKADSSQRSQWGSLRIVREKFNMSAKKTKVFVDRKLQGEIRDGESITVLLKPGEHKIRLHSRFFHKHAYIFGDAREVTRTISIMANTETAVYFSSTPFDHGRHKIKRVTETEWPSPNKPSVESNPRKSRFLSANRDKS